MRLVLVLGKPSRAGRSWNWWKNFPNMEKTGNSAWFAQERAAEPFFYNFSTLYTIIITFFSKKVKKNWYFYQFFIFLSFSLLCKGQFIGIFSHFEENLPFFVNNFQIFYIFCGFPNIVLSFQYTKKQARN